MSKQPQSKASVPKDTRALPGMVYLVGAGPGDPELLTVRALRLLSSADLVLHDDLVPDEVLRLAGEAAEVVSVGKRCGQARITQAGIHELMIQAAKGGRSVLRLKSGDPLVFGRAGEEIEALREAGVPFAVVPGVTAAMAAGASLALPLTDRNSASKLVLITGHHAAGKDVGKPVWQGPLPEDATLAVYMPGRDLGRLGGELVTAGVGEDVPVAVVSNAATGRQSYVAGRLKDLGNLECGPAPLLVLAGWAVERLLRAQEDYAAEIQQAFELVSRTKLQ